MAAHRLHRLNALFTLTARYAGESSGGVLGDTLDVLLRTTSALGGVAFLASPALEQVADRGLSSAGNKASPLRRALRALADRAAESTKPLYVADLRQSPEWGPTCRPLVEQGAVRALVQPILLRRAVVGILVLLFESRTSVDEELLNFTQTVAQACALAIDRDHPPLAAATNALELEDAQRMASLGLLTASVAHELRGPAGALILQMEELRRLELQLRECDDTHDPVMGNLLAELGELLDDMSTATARVRDTVDQLSTVSRRDTEPEHLDLSDVVLEALSVARPHLERRGIALEQQLTAGCYTSGRRDNLSHVVLNLVLNAADASLAVKDRSPEVRVRTELADNHVALVVEDTGAGVPSTAIKTIFQPFFTTKKRGQGTGLGLKICSDVVAAHGGHIEVVSRSPGTAFRVLLPRLSDDSGVHPVSNRQSEDPETLQPLPNRQILVVDDDPVFSRTVRRALKPHDVRTAGTASEAEIALLDPKYTPDVILCDVFLPGANGNTLHERVCRSRPDLAAHFVFVTGGALGKEEADYLRESGCRTLFKPLDMQDLLNLLRAPVDETMPKSVRTLGSNRPHTRRSSMPPGS